MTGLQEGEHLLESLLPSLREGNGNFQLMPLNFSVIHLFLPQVRANYFESRDKATGVREEEEQQEKCMYMYVYDY